MDLAATVARVTTDRTRIIHELLPKLVLAVAANEEVQRKFRTAVLIRLSKIETMLTEVQVCQLAEFWPQGKVTDEQRAKYIQEAEERGSSGSKQLLLKMVRYVYGPSEEAFVPHDGRRKWSGWQI